MASTNPPLPRWKWWLYQPYKVFVFGPLMVLSTLVSALGVVALLPFFGARTVSRLCGGGWARFNAFLTPMRVSVEGREHVDRRQSYVIVSNHQSHYDVFVLYGWLGVDFKWVMKQELRSVPALGYACDRLGHIYIDRFDRQAALASIARAKERIVNGTSVLFFPEGTRSRAEGMRPFKKGAFHMALDLGLPILPVTIVGTRDVLPPHTQDLRPGRARLVIHEPIPVAGLVPEQVPELVARVRQAIAGPLGGDPQQAVAS